MSKRQLVKRVPSDKAQGKGSWVEFKLVTYGERQELSDEAALHKDDESNEWAKAQERRLYTDHIIGWNWVDENDNPLPVPSEDETVLNGLTSDEISFLNELFGGPSDPKK